MKFKMDKIGSNDGNIFGYILNDDGTPVLDEMESPLRMRGNFAHILPPSPSEEDIAALIRNEVRKTVAQNDSRKAAIISQANKITAISSFPPNEVVIPPLPEKPIITAPSPDSTLSSPIMVEGTCDKSIVSLDINGSTINPVDGIFSVGIGFVAGARSISITASNSVGETSGLTVLGVTIV